MISVAYILIVVSTANGIHGANYVITSEFASEERCKSAAQIVAPYVKLATCVPK